MACSLVLPNVEEYSKSRVYSNLHEFSIWKVNLSALVNMLIDPYPFIFQFKLFIFGYRWDKRIFEFIIDNSVNMVRYLLDGSISRLVDSPSYFIPIIFI